MTQVTLCEKCFPTEGRDIETLTMSPIAPCEQCARYDSRGTPLDLRCNVFRSDPRDMPEFMKRVAAETSQLEIRVEKLTAFLGTDGYARLVEAERVRLRAQLLFMVGYLAVLHDRLESWQ